ncbi:MAG: hypothetical protein ACOYLN_14980, partial [Blastocatellia bacterium]
WNLEPGPYAVLARQIEQQSKFHRVPFPKQLAINSLFTSAIATRSSIGSAPTWIKTTRITTRMQTPP